MTVASLDHVNIFSSRMRETIAFYVDLLGMEAKSPMGGDISEAAWIFAANGHPVIHLGSASGGTDFLGEASSGRPAAGSGVIHHVALECTDYAAMRARLERSEHPLRFNDVPQMDLRQIFIHDPNGILVELNFR